MKVERFLNEEVVDYASYTILRAIASLVDGQKNAARKAINTTLKINKDTKVSILSGIVSIENEYLHGPTSLEGVIVALAQNYPGANNLPLFTREGNFGTRFEHEASASRYIFTAKEPYLDKIFKPEDSDILIKQVFEGTTIEPRFYVPTIPLILVNGSEGIATGYAQKILPRNIEDIKNYISDYLAGKKTKELKPYFNGFRGSIEKGETENQWLIKGKLEVLSLTKVMITELPIGYSLKSYTKVLDSLEDKKTIKSYKDLSEDDNFKFEVTFESKNIKRGEEWLYKTLKLEKKVTENFTVIDEDNKIKVYSSPEEVINHYIKVKLKYTKKRKEKQINDMLDKLKLLKSKYLFIKNIVEKNITINKRKKNDIEKDLENYEGIIKYKDSYNYLLNMPLYSLTEEKLNDLITEIKTLKNEKDILESKTEKNIWEEEINAL